MLFQFLLLSLITWRVTHLLSEEDGPFDIIYRLRRKMGSGLFGTLLDCFYCLSLWISLPLACAAGATTWEKIMYWWALSAAACLLQQATTCWKEPISPTPEEEP